MLKRKPNEAGILTQILVYIVLIIGVVISFFPFYLMFVSSTHTSGEILSLPPKLNIGSNLINNFKKLNDDIGILRVFFNSLFIAVVYTILTVLLSSMAGYAFAKFNFKGKKIFFAIVLATIMIPNQVLLVPLFDMMNKFGWINTYKAVLIPTLANAFGIFLMRQNMLSFPDSVIEAARIDGYGEFSIFFKIVLPTMRPALGALAIYMFMNQWNNFMWPLIVLRTKNMYTLPIALSTLNGMSRIDYGEIMLGTTIATLPIMIVFLIFQKQFIKGVLGGAVKG
ncbi:carbohydrate ABC transporter permease [Thermobrachium celere]|uniref:Binding-protein-dependent transport systems inner membrane component n=1 Tax=Thermobrachium celere DSM 8682 TaxID=941824 RepID=R7RTR9_9CLOT|nr:carbohydrate ABC transporter permease [Thermobrachium celere]CDF58806.1 binding-protein-dependent transport systems inner membrane component [Thermobrachium celere DSM 8682]